MDLANNQPDPRHDLAFLKAEHDRLIQSQLNQQRLDWELQRLEIDLHLLQQDQIRQQQDLDQQLQDDLEANRRDLEQQRAELQQQQEELQQFRQQIRAERAALQDQSHQPEQIAPDSEHGLIRYPDLERASSQWKGEFWNTDLTPQTLVGWEFSERLTKEQQQTEQRFEESRLNFEGPYHPEGNKNLTKAADIFLGSADTPEQHQQRQQWHEYRKSIPQSEQDHTRNEGIER